MLDASSHGRVAPRSKTINVGANLLTERLDVARRASIAANRILLLIALTVLTGLMATVAVLKFYGAKTAEMVRISAQLEVAQKELSNSVAKAQAIGTRAADNAMNSRSKDNAKKFLGNVLAVMNAGSDEISTSTIHAEVASGVMTINCQAASASFDGMRRFVEACKKSPAVEVAYLVSNKLSTKLGPKGQEFELVKKAKVGL